jgi:hypothetical protein
LDLDQHVARLRLAANHPFANSAWTSPSPTTVEGSDKIAGFVARCLPRLCLMASEKAGAEPGELWPIVLALVVNRRRRAAASARAIDAEGTSDHADDREQAAVDSDIAGEVS